MADAELSAVSSGSASASRPEASSSAPQESVASNLQTPMSSARSGSLNDRGASPSGLPPPVSPINKTAGRVVFSVSSYLQPDTELFVSGDPWGWSTDRSEIVRLQRMPTGRSNHDGPAYIWSGSCDATSIPETFEYKFLWFAENQCVWESCIEGAPDRRRWPKPVDAPNVERFRDGYANESELSIRFYSRIISDNDIHFNKIADRIYAGSCPRQAQHIDLLQSLGIVAVLNLQTLEDIEVKNNGLPGLLSATKLSQCYLSRGMGFKNNFIKKKSAHATIFNLFSSKFHPK